MINFLAKQQLDNMSDYKNDEDVDEVGKALLYGSTTGMSQNIPTKKWL